MLLLLCKIGIHSLTPNKMCNWLNRSAGEGRAFEGNWNGSQRQWKLFGIETTSGLPYLHTSFTFYVFCVLKCESNYNLILQSCMFLFTSMLRGINQYCGKHEIGCVSPTRILPKHREGPLPVFVINSSVHLRTNVLTVSVRPIILIHHHNSFKCNQPCASNRDCWRQLNNESIWCNKLARYLRA